MPGLRLQSPSVRDHNGAIAGASDHEAQRWLEWPDKYRVPTGKRERFLSVRPGTGLLLPSRLAPGVITLVAIDPALDRLAGFVSMDWETREIGGSLVPEYRSRGLGAALFAAGAELAHRHLGITTVHAGAHPGNAACIGALTAAGFTPAPGPVTHVQPNGRVIPARWFRHERDQAGHCNFRRRPSLGLGPDRYDQALDAPQEAGRPSHQPIRTDQ
jgi:RimJ/RimL family protein N-acetyltransferase